LESKAEQLGVPVPHKVLEFLAHRITANVRELEGALNRVVAQAQLVNREISLENTQDYLKDLLRANDRRVTIEEIQKAVVEHYSIRMADMTSARRSRAVARPRQMAMYLAKQLTPRSLPEIGKKFGGRDHTTVMHGIKKIEADIKNDDRMQRQLMQIRQQLYGQAAVA
jgi:chromosomal replication initiator protein